MTEPFNETLPESHVVCDNSTNLIHCKMITQEVVNHQICGTQNLALNYVYE